MNKMKVENGLVGGIVAGSVMSSSTSSRGGQPHIEPPCASHPSSQTYKIVKSSWGGD